MPATTTRPPSLLTRGARPPAWSDTPNGNVALGTVGPNVAEPGGVQFDLVHAQAWSGWPDKWATPYLEDWDRAAYGGEWSGFGYGRHDADGYLRRVSTVMTAVDLNSRQLASFPAYAMRGDTPELLPSWSLNPEPEVYAGWDEFIKAAANTYQLRGEVFLWATARFADGWPSRFVALDPDRVSVAVHGGRLAYALDDEELDALDVCHIKFQTMPGRRRGITPLHWLGRNLASATALEAYATDIATHGVWAILKHPANLNAAQSTDLQARWRAARAAGRSTPAVLSGGVEFETLSLNPKDMALLDLKIYDEQRIAAAFGVPPFLIGLEQPGGLTYSNATSLYDHHWRATLRPMAQTFSNAMSQWLLPRGHHIEFNRDEYVRPALNERAAAYATLHGIEEEGRHAMTVDEIRSAERYAPYTIAGDVVPLTAPQ